MGENVFGTYNRDRAVVKGSREIDRLPIPQTAMGSRLVSSKAALAAVLAAFAVATTGCGGAQAETVEDCVRDFPAGVTSTLPPAQAAHVSHPKLGRVARPLCEALVQEQSTGGLSTERETVSVLRHVVQTRPALWRPVCNALVDAEFRSMGSLLRAVSKRDRARYRQGTCTLGVRYMRADGSVDLGRMVRRHRALFVPFCAAGIRQALDQDAGARRAFTRSQRLAIALRS